MTSQLSLTHATTNHRSATIHTIQQYLLFKHNGTVSDNAEMHYTISIMLEARQPDTTLKLDRSLTVARIMEEVGWQLPLATSVHTTELN
jgi:hypothetical protein